MREPDLALTGPVHDTRVHRPEDEDGIATAILDAEFGARPAGPYPSRPSQGIAPLGT
ncbi:hypothetical protein GCM10010177_79440 [Actinomadura citrea]|nr:hypothetical protein GCM10010177_79440 [Actinomadura citrea]